MQLPAVLFVCLGNICRSPTAHGIFSQHVKDANLSGVIRVDSCGTGDWHIGHAPDARSASAALQKGYQIEHLRARKFSPNDFDQFSYILAMDENNLNDLSQIKPHDYGGELALFLPFSNNEATVREVPDPYYGGSEGFHEVVELVEAASASLLVKIRQAHGL